MHYNYTNTLHFVQGLSSVSYIIPVCHTCINNYVLIICNRIFIYSINI